MDTGFPLDNNIISYNNGDMLYLDKTETEGFYYTGLTSLPYMPLRRVPLNCLLVEDKIYIMKEEPCYYA